MVASPSLDWEEKFEALPLQLQEIAWCESRLVVNAKNKVSSASGLFQFIDGTFKWIWEEVYDTPVDWNYKNDPHIQIELAYHLWKNHGAKHWECYTLDMI